MRLAVVYIGDANYNELSLYSLASIALRHRHPLDFHFMQAGYAQEIPSALQRLVNEKGHRLFAGRVDFETPNLASRANSNTYTYISDAMFLRAIAIETLVPDYDYILYVDGDTLAFADLEIERHAGFEEPLAACIDMTMAGGNDFYAAQWRSEKPPVLFNSGVLLVNSAAWRARGIYGRFLEALRRHAVACPYFRHCEPNDQCALNMALEGEWRVLDMALNVQKVAIGTRAWSSAKLRHYTGRLKFIPVTRHRCDPREYALLRTLATEAGLANPGTVYDAGVSYKLNSLRRVRAIAQAECTLQRIASRSMCACGPTPAETG